MLHIGAERLRDFVANAYRKVGISESDARKIAELQTEADLRGADGHGVFRLPQYIRRIKSGGVNVAPNIRIERQTAAMAHPAAGRAEPDKAHRANGRGNSHAAAPA